MISEERKTWIKAHKLHGEIQTAVDNLNRKGIEIKPNNAQQIISKGITSETGIALWNELEKVIRKRIAKLEKEKALYATS